MCPDHFSDAPPPEKALLFELLLTTAHRLAIEVTEELSFEHVSVMGLLVVRLLVRGRCAPRAVAAALGCSRAAAGQLVIRLVRDGFVERTPDAHDGRSCVLGLTPSGEQYGAFATEAMNRCMDSVTQHLDTEEKESLGALLTRVERGADWHRSLRLWTTPLPVPRRPPAIHVR